jgi:hypothetical protein
MESFGMPPQGFAIGSNNKLKNNIGIFIYRKILCLSDSLSLFFVFQFPGGTKCS